jgi:tRNA(fMet)-specific endonuclease VapC
VNYLLDTCTISQWVRGNVGVLQRLKIIPPQQIGISTITYMEVEYGLKINPQRAAKIYPVIHSLLTVVTIIPYTQEDANTTAEIRTILKARGIPIGPYDVMLAGCAKQRGLIIVTDNLAEFQRIEGIVVENWVSRP